jgi:hypothetical protein
MWGAPGGPQGVIRRAADIEPDPLARGWFTVASGGKPDTLTPPLSGEEDREPGGG